MARNSNHISIVQCDERLISRMRVLSKPGKLEILAFDQEHGAWSAQDGTLEAALRDFSGRFHLADDAVVTILPRHDITTRILVLPSDKPEEIASMIRFSAEEYVPYTAEELMLSQCVLRLLPTGEARVLAAFAHRDVVEGHMRLLAGAGIVPEHVYLSTACLATAVAEARPDASGDFALVNLASGGLEALTFDRDGHLMFGRGVASGQQWHAPDGEVAGIFEELSVELRATLSAYRREAPDSYEVERVYLAADAAFVETLAQGLETETAVQCRPADFLPALVGSGAQHLAAPALSALGAALLAQGRGEVLIDLVPESVKEDQRIRVVKRQALKAGFLATLVLVAVGLWFYQQVRQREAYRVELETRLQGLAARAGGVVEKREQLRIIRREVRPSGSVLQYLANVCRAAPDGGLNLTEFRFDHEDGIEVKGRAESLDLINGFGQSLRELGKTTGLEQFLGATRMYENDNIPEQDKRIWEYHYTIPFEEKEAENADASLGK
ncbi:MAG: hypothetical protein KA184_03480 [Candidatus Hydrogenedentes bacterium]|nr:hypothetical protein [Candidatus Hydrogenedentota bacterium]